MLKQWNVLVNKLVLLGSKTYNTLLQNWLYLVLAFIAPLLIYYVSQGQEIILSLFNPSQYINIFFILISFILIFFFIWVIPVYSIELAIYIHSIVYKNIPTGTFRKDKIFTQLAYLYNSNLQQRAVFPIRKFGGIPLLIFLFSLSLVYWQPLKSIFLFVLFLLVSLSIIEMSRAWFVKYATSVLKNSPFWGYLGHLFLILVASICWRFGPSPTFLPMGYSMAMVFIWLLFIYNDLFQYLIEKLSSSEGVSELKKNYNLANVGKILNFYSKSRNVYTVALILLLGIIIVISILQYFITLHFVSAILVLNICFTVYIAFIDLVLKTPKDVFKLMSNPIINDESKGGIYKAAHFPLPASTDNKLYLFFNFINVVVVFLSINTIFIKSINDHKLHKIRLDHTSYLKYERTDSLLSYFNKWLDYKQYPETVNLVVASGGGSRAGYWTGINMDSLALLYPSFRKNLFAMATISGSTSGANMLISKWFLESERSIRPNDSFQEFWKKAYTYNYLSSSIWGLLISDGLRGWLSGDDDFDKDRNYYHELDEINAFKMNYEDLHHSLIDTMMLADYMYKWSDQSRRFELPIHLVNSATTQAGKRVIVTPYTFSDSIHTTAIDLHKQFRNTTKSSCTEFALPMVACVKISESFPIISAYSYLQGVGNLIDGGIYENTGSNTMYELYTYLKEKFPEQKFCVYFLLNSDIDNCNTDPVNSVVGNTISSLSSTPFSGHSYYWVNRFQRALNSYPIKDTFKLIEIKDNRGNWKDFPLGIQLSNQTIDSIYSCIKSPLK